MRRHCNGDSGQRAQSPSRSVLSRYNGLWTRQGRLRRRGDRECGDHPSLGNDQRQKDRLYRAGRALGHDRHVKRQARRENLLRGVYRGWRQSHEPPGDVFLQRRSGVVVRVSSPRIIRAASHTHGHAAVHSTRAIYSRRQSRQPARLQRSGIHRSGRHGLFGGGLPQAERRLLGGRSRRWRDQAVRQAVPDGL